MHSTSGTTIGPPADIEYAVEPVGVARITPSALKEPTSSRLPWRPTCNVSGVTRAAPDV